MKIIEKIEIKYFRSFADKKVEISNLNDLNIFSGSNDSGKSNILRALNLFFNNVTNSGDLFSIKHDLSKLHWEKSDGRAKKKRDGGLEGVRQKDLFVEVKIHFSLPLDLGGMLPRKFFVSRRWTDAKNNPPYQDNNVETRYKKEKGELTTNQKNALQGQLTQFLRKIDFRYVPAIKERAFFKHLYKELQGRLLEKEISEIRDKSQQLQAVIKEETVELFNEFKKSTGIDASFFLLEDNLINFEKSVEVETFGNIFLPNRGDGIQARFIPDILNELSKNNKSRKYILWGFEEPENSYELKNIKKLRDNFTKIYSKDKQIFITTHSREFLSIKNGDEKSNRTSIYRVYKKADSSSQIAFYDDEDGFNKERIQLSFWNGEQKTKNRQCVLDELFSDLGIIDESRKITELEDLIKNNHEKLEELDYVISALKKPVIFVEDEKTNLYKIAWLKLNDIKFSINNFVDAFNKNAPFVIHSVGGNEELYKKLDMVKMDEFLGKRVVGIFDFDDAFKRFNGLGQGRWGEKEGEEKSCIFKRRLDNQNIFAILIPVPKHRKTYASIQQRNNFLIIEHLFDDNVLKNSGHLNSQVQDIGAGGSIIKINKKGTLWISSSKFNKNYFKGFAPLFNRVNKLLNL
jgi:AAA15 family ATPase/GTPase